MRTALKAALFALSPLSVAADGPALAHLTLGETTITLTDVGRGQAGQTFAQMHLGFPMPPVLHLMRVTQPDGTMTLEVLRLNGTTGGSNGAGTHLGAETFLLLAPHDAVVTGDADTFRIEATALGRTPLGQFTPLPVRIDVQMTSP